MKKTRIILIFWLIAFNQLFAANQIIDLVIDYQMVQYTTRPFQAITVNHQIPGPTLHFKEGDEVVIHVHNRLKEKTTIHWHGILVPWQMDGVEGVSQRGIEPGCSFTYRFKPLQSGTYWYHAHAGLQEQQGLYGAIVIDPVKPPSFYYNKDFVVVLSDWINTHPDQVLANLKKDGDYYSPKFPLQASLAKFIHDYRKANHEERRLLLNDYKMMQQMRMSIYDINDVAYDAFLMNGHSLASPWLAQVKKGDIVRLRFIGASSETIFRVKVPGSMMTMVHVQGNDVKPYKIHDFSIAPGETYDVLINIDKDEPSLIYAESLDKVDATIGALVSKNEPINLNVQPFEEPLPITRQMMHSPMPHDMAHDHMSHHHMTNDHMAHNHMTHDQMAHDHTAHDHMAHDHISHGHITHGHITHDHMAHEKHTKHHPMHHGPHQRSDHQSNPQPLMSDHSQHGSHHMPTEPSIIGDKITHQPVREKTTGTKYQNLEGAVKTNDPDKPVAGVIQLELFGYMNHFIWMINGLTEFQAKPIQIEPNKRYRLIFTNNSMMRHPMHIHGHWFILRNGHGSYDPLLHTIEVPPMSKVVADIETEASGQWFFHCHMIYHMASGMARVFQYTSLIELSHHKSKPLDIVKSGAYKNRPTVKVDELRPLDEALIQHPMGHHPGFWAASFLDIGADPIHDNQQLTYKGLYGPDYHKLELMTKDAELDHGQIENADIDIFYWHLVRQFWAVKGGINYFNRPALHPYWQLGIGIEGLFPYFIETDLRTYFYRGSVKLDLEIARDSQITNNFFIRTGLRTILASKTIPQAQLGSGLNELRAKVRLFYRLYPGLNVFTEYEYERFYGAFKRMQSQLGEETLQHTLSFGLSLII